MSSVSHQTDGSILAYLTNTGALSGPVFDVTNWRSL